MPLLYHRTLKNELSITFYIIDYKMYRLFAQRMSSFIYSENTMICSSITGMLGGSFIGTYMTDDKQFYHYPFEMHEYTRPSDITDYIYNGFIGSVFGLIFAPIILITSPVIIPALGAGYTGYALKKLHRKN